MGPEVNRRSDNRRVLLVDGNWMFRHAAALVLSGEGYEVLEAITAKEGLAVMAAEKGRIDIVVSEVFFPGESMGQHWSKRCGRLIQNSNASSYRVIPRRRWRIRWAKTSRMHSCSNPARRRNLPRR